MKRFVLAALALLVPLHAATFTVDTLDDQDGTIPAETSLREAIAAAAEGDTILFDASLNGGTITLQHGFLPLARSLEIDATALARGITLDGARASRILAISDGTDPLTTVTVRNVAFINGFATGSATGGAVLAVTFPPHTHLLKVTFVSCHFARNSTDGAGGGAISASGNVDLDLFGCSVVENSDSAILVSADPLPSLPSPTTIEQCTIACNQGRGVWVIDGPIQLHHSTVAFNKGIGVVGATTLTHSIVAANEGSVNIGAGLPVTSGGHNILGDPAPSYAVATDVLTDDPQLFEPMRRGGITHTCAFRPSSPACDAGDPSVAGAPSADQRGCPRIKDGDDDFFSTAIIDIGAFELGETLWVDTNDDENFGLTESQTSLREALSIAASTDPGTRIELPENYFCTLEHGPLEVSSTVWVDHPYTSRATIRPDATVAHRIFLLDGAVLEEDLLVEPRVLESCTPGAPTFAATLQGLDLADADAPETGSEGPPAERIVYYGAALAACETHQVNVLETTISDCRTSGLGSAIATTGHLYLRQVRIEDCTDTAVWAGAGITAVNTLFRGNASTFGGAMQLWGPSRFEHCTFRNNTASNSAGAVSAYADFDLSHCVFSDNVAGDPATRDFFISAPTGITAFGPNAWSDAASPHAAPGDPTGDLHLDAESRPVPFLSPLIDLGPSRADSKLCRNADLAGRPRFVNGTGGGIEARADLGALESARDIVVTTLVDNLDANDGETSLREAVALANADDDKDVITFATSTPAKVAIDPLLGSLTLSAPVHLRGMGRSAYHTEIDGQGSRVFDITAANVTLELLTLSDAGNPTVTNGGAIRINQSAADPFAVTDPIVIRNCWFRNNTAGRGGAIGLDYREVAVVIDSCAFSYNRATTDYGGAIYFSEHVHPFTLTTFEDTVANSTFHANFATSDGSAICLNVLPAGSSTTPLLSHLTLTANVGSNPVAADHPVPSSSHRLEACLIAGNIPNNFIEPLHAFTDAETLEVVTLDGLKPFGDHGGPTPTVALTAASAAIDRGTATGALDQRGATTQDGDGNSTATRDAGAFEFVPPIVVTTALDEHDGPFAGTGVSLREAIDAAHTTPHALIQFSPALDGATITLATPDPLSGRADALDVFLGHSMTIDASTLPNGITLTDDLNESVPSGYPSPAAHELIRFSFASGAGESYLGLENLRLSNPGLHAVSAGGRLRIHRCRFEDNSEPGGHSALVTNDRVELSDTTFRNNGASRGGALFNDGFGTVTQCTFTGNTAAEGAVVGNEGFLHFKNCTFSNNTAVDLPGPGLTAAGAIAYQSSFGLIPDNRTATLTFEHCLFDDPIGTPLFADESGFPGAVASLGANLTRSAVPQLNDPTDFTSTDDLLESFVDAPVPGYFPLRPATDAVDVINPGLDDPARDVREFPRPLDGDGDGFAFLDVGATEAPPVLLVDTAVDENDGIASGGVSLRDAVTHLNGFGGSPKPLIRFHPFLDGATLVQNHVLGEILVSTDMTIDASTLSTNPTLLGPGSSGSSFRLMQVNTGGGPVKITGLNFKDGDSTQDGGALFVTNFSFVELRDCLFENNRSLANGGALAVTQNAFASIHNCAFIDNFTDQFGGALFASNAPALLEQCTLFGNRALLGGGAIADLDPSDFSIFHCTIVGNTCDNGPGGGIDLNNSTAHCSHTILGDNLPFNFHDRNPGGPHRIDSHGHNIEDPSNGTTFFDPTDISGPSGLGLDPLSTAFGRTPVIPLRFDSPALDSGDPVIPSGFLATDQTGINPRVSDGNFDGSATIDRGAFELDPSTLDPDIDGDDIPNSWEVRHSLDPYVSNTFVDTDGDQRSDLDEYEADSDPQDRGSYFRIVSIVDTFGNQTEMEIEWTSSPNRRYDVLTSPDAVIWTPARTAVEGQLGTTSVGIPVTQPGTSRLLFKVTTMP